MKGKSRVYFIPADGKEARGSRCRPRSGTAYLAIGFNDRIAEDDFVALKIHFGEKNNTGYIKPAVAQAGSSPRSGNGRRGPS